MSQQRSVRIRCIPSIALARMALNLAGRREWNLTEVFGLGAKPLPRAEISGGDFPSLSAEYYRIIDRISRGEKP